MNLFNEINSIDLEKTAIIEGSSKLSYAHLLEKIESLKNFIDDKHLEKTKRIGLPPMSSTGLLISYYACQEAGNTPVPIPFIDKERVEGAVGQANISLILEDPIREFAAERVPYSQVSEITNIEKRCDEALILFTSGTTSDKLKGVRLAHEGISSACLYMNQLMEIDSNIVELVFAQLDHAFGFGRCHCILRAGGTLILPPSLRSLSTIFDLLENNNCNALSTPPSILSSLLRLSSSDKFKQFATKIRRIQTGAMRFDTFFRQRLLDTFPNTRIFLHYGLSEAMRVTLFELSAHPDKIHTEGPPSIGIDLNIFDEDFNQLPANIEGSIGLRGKHLCLGYLDEKSWQKQIHKGYFITSDRGMIDDDGFLVFMGRSDDTINANGVLVHPDEIENKILSVWSDLIFSVLGVNDPAGIKDSIIVLCIEGKETKISLAELKKKLSAIDPHLIPQVIIEFDKLPRTRTDKVNRNELRQWVTKHLKSNTG